ncbi:MAG: RdgB/HAM1 family non-canonical purine NTP pyrophosphatase [Clostridia bacterium]|nr:RdgB/HAM1 family non-canonical purine NTP pyrophosphatase [Clostridia bacterium]
MELVIASNNKNKVREIREILKGKFEAIYSLSDLGIVCEAEETAPDFMGNALIKARAVAAFTDKAVLADDSGLMVSALGGAPGVYSARYAGEHASDEQNNDLLLKNLEGKENREAQFAATVVLLYPSGEIFAGEGFVKGEILKERKGKSGFGYDPLFYSYELKKTFGEATEEEKNGVSHRARALENLLAKL